MAIAVVSAGKAFKLAGLKCAAVVTGSARMPAAVAPSPPDTRRPTGHLGVIASVAAFNDGGDWLDQLIGTLDRRREQLAGLLAERPPHRSWVQPEATFLA